MKKELLNNTKVLPLLEPTVTPLSAGTSYTSFIDRKSFLSAVIALATGEASGSPTAQSVKITVQSANDSSGTGKEDLTDINGDKIEIELTDDSLSSFADVDLTGAKAFLGCKVVVALTAGTTPAIPVNIFAVLGDITDTREI
jgi:hypothetical protein